MSNEAKFTAEIGDERVVKVAVDSLDGGIVLSLHGENVANMMYSCCDSFEYCDLLTVSRDKLNRELKIDFSHTNNSRASYTLSINGDRICICKNNQDKRNDYIIIRDWRDPGKISLNKE